MRVYLNIAQILVSLAIIGLVLMQSKDTGLGSVFGGDSSVYRTRRGVERTLFHLTIGLCTLFLLISLLSVLVK